MKKDFKEVYKLPLSLDGFGCKVFTKEYTMAFDFMDGFMNYPHKLIISKHQQERIVDMINENENNSIFKKGIKHELLYDCGMIYIKYNNIKHSFILIRGWGHLTGIGGLNLTEKEAKEIQDDFGNWIVEVLKGEN